MKRIMLTVVLLTLACTHSTRTVVAPPPAAAGSVRGVVQANDGSALPGVTVTISSQNGTRTEVSDAGGAFLFAGVAPGSYEIRAELSGYGSTTRRVSVTSAGAA